jgi:hypothetical protein
MVVRGYRPLANRPLGCWCCQRGLEILARTMLGAPHDILYTFICWYTITVGKSPAKYEVKKKKKIADKFVQVLYYQRYND